MERYFGGALCYGPDIEDGFYYDMWMGSNSVSSEADMPKLEKLYYQMMKEKQPFEVLQYINLIRVRCSNLKSFCVSGRL